MIRFRASSLLAVYFLFQALQSFQAGAILNGIFQLIIAVCLFACTFNRPFNLGNIITFSGW